MAFSQSQYAVLKYIDTLAQKYPNTFDTQQMTLDIKNSMSEVIVVQAFVSYKENLFEDPQIRDAALAALDAALMMENGLNAKDIALQATESLEESGTGLTQEEIDAIAGATYDILQETGGTDGTDGTASASLTVEPGEQLQAGDTGVDGTTSASITANDPSVPTDGSTVDAVTSATPAGGSGTSTGGGVSAYDDDDDDDRYEETL